MPWNGKSTGFKACDAHPKIPASGDCKGCGKPICGLCRQKSGDPDLCPECKITERLTGRVPDPSSANRAGRPAEAEVGGGMIGKEEAPSTTDRSGQHPAAYMETITSITQYGEKTAENRPVRGLEAGSSDKIYPGTDHPGKEDAGATTTAASASPETGQPDLHETSGAPDKAVPSEMVKIPIPVHEQKYLRKKGPKTGTRHQLLYCVPSGIAVGVVVVAFWILLAWMAGQWTQLSVITLGLIVPWAMVEWSTKKRHWGQRIWRKPPKAHYTAAFSLGTVAVLTVIMELLARQVIFGSRFSIDDFMARYFSPGGWVVVALGLVLATATPFLLRAPSLQNEYRGLRRRGPERTGPPDSVPSAGDPEKAVPLLQDGAQGPSGSDKPETDIPT